MIEPCALPPGRVHLTVHLSLLALQGLRLCLQGVEPADLTVYDRYGIFGKCRSRYSKGKEKAAKASWQGVDVRWSPT